MPNAEASTELLLKLRDFLLQLQRLLALFQLSEVTRAAELMVQRRDNHKPSLVILAKVLKALMFIGICVGFLKGTPLSDACHSNTFSKGTCIFHASHALQHTEVVILPTGTFRPLDAKLAKHSSSNFQRRCIQPLGMKVFQERPESFILEEEVWVLPLFMLA